MDPVFITGGTGYLGVPLIEALLARGYSVHALARPGSERKLPRGTVPVIGNALDSASCTAGHMFYTPLCSYRSLACPWRARRRAPRSRYATGHGGCACPRR